MTIMIKLHGIHMTENVVSHYMKNPHDHAFTMAHITENLIIIIKNFMTDHDIMKMLRN